METTATDPLTEVVTRLGSSRSNESAWQLLHAQLWPLLFATSYRILRGNRHLAEDAAQDAFLRLFRYAQFEAFKDNPPAFRSYALAICRNVGLGYLSRLLKDPKCSEESSDDSISTVSSPSSNPEMVAI